MRASSFSLTLSAEPRCYTAGLRGESLERRTGSRAESRDEFFAVFPLGKHAQIYAPLLPLRLCLLRSASCLHWHYIWSWSWLPIVATHPNPCHTRGYSIAWCPVTLSGARGAEAREGSLQSSLRRTPCLAQALRRALGGTSEPQTPIDNRVPSDPSPSQSAVGKSE